MGLAIKMLTDAYDGGGGWVYENSKCLRMLTLSSVGGSENPKCLWMLTLMWGLEGVKGGGLKCLPES